MKKHLQKIKDCLKRKKHHLGYATSALLFLGLGLLLAQNNIIGQPASEPKETAIEEPEFFEEEFVDPREIENALRDISRMKGEAKGLLKRVVKLATPDLKARLGEIIAELEKFALNIKKPPKDYTTREAMQEFYEARMWEEIHKIRAQVELPQILKELPKVVRRIEKLLKLKAYQKIGLDLVSINNYLAEIKEAYTEADNLYKQGNYEEAMEALEFIQETGHPGELEGALRRLKEINNKIRIVKDKQLKEQLLNLLVPVTEAINEGDFRIAHEILNDLQKTIFEIIKRTYKMNAKSRTEILKRISEMEEKVTNELEEWEVEQLKIEEERQKKEKAEIQPVPEVKPQVPEVKP